MSNAQLNTVGSPHPVPGKTGTDLQRSTSHLFSAQFQAWMTSIAIITSSMRPIKVSHVKVSTPDS